MRSALLLVSIAAVLGGCVTAPYENQTFNARTDSIYFEGYAQNSGATVEFQCRVGSSWIVVDTADADVNPINPTQPTPLHKFSKSIVLPASCWTVPFEFDYRATVRVHEPGSDMTALQTFTEDGLTCIGNELLSSSDWVATGFGCKGSQGTELSLIAHY